MCNLPCIVLYMPMPRGSMLNEEPLSLGYLYRGSRVMACRGDVG